MEKQANTPEKEKYKIPLRFCELEIPMEQIPFIAVAMKQDLNLTDEEAHSFVKQMIAKQKNGSKTAGEYFKGD